MPTRARGQQLTPFLQAFEEEMKKTEQAWPEIPQILEFLGVSNPVEGAKLAGAGDYPVVKEFADIRKTTQLHNTLADPDRKTPQRFMAAPPAKAAIFPYRG